jgi:predicted enzyme related to lactoylglutathione lyase
MKKNPVGWFEIYVQDMARARTFYEAVLEGKLEKLEAGGVDMWAFPGEQGGNGSAGSLVHMPGFPSGGNSTLVYFVCADCSVEEGRVKKHGGRVEKTKFSIGPYGFISLVYDTEGNMFGLHSMK